MEIGPIPGVRAVQAVRPPAANAGLPAVFDIENFARIGDETYSPSGGRSAGGFEDDEDDLADATPDLEDEAEPEPAMLASGNAPGRQISFFA